MSATNSHLSDEELPKAEEIGVTTTTDDKKVLSMSKGAVGAAIAGGLVGGVFFGAFGLVVLAGGAVYWTTKSDKMEKRGETFYDGLQATTNKGKQCFAGKFSQRNEEVEGQ